MPCASAPESHIIVIIDRPGLTIPGFGSTNGWPVRSICSNIRLISCMSADTVRASISRMRDFCGVRLSAATKPASRSATLSSMTRPLPERDDCTTAIPALAASFRAAFCAGDGEPDGKPAEMRPFAPAANAAATSAASAPA